MPGMRHLPSLRLSSDHEPTAQPRGYRLPGELDLETASEANIHYYSRNDNADACAPQGSGSRRDIAHFASAKPGAPEDAPNAAAHVTKAKLTMADRPKPGSWTGSRAAA